MAETTAIKNLNNTIKDDIYYLIKNGEISFFYKDFLLFKHNKNNPAISVIISKGEAEKEIPLINYDINKTNINEYDIDFYNQLYKIKIHLKLVKNILDLQVNNSNKYPALKLSLKNSVGKIKGFGCCKDDIFLGKEICSDGWSGEERKEYSDDKILSFFKEKKYFLCIEGNYEWKVRFGSLIEMYLKKTNFFNVKVVFCKDIEDIKALTPSFSREIFDKKGIVIKSTVAGLENLVFSGKNQGKIISTVILCDDHIDFWDLCKIREKLKKRNIKTLRKVQPKISLKDDYFKEFDAEDFVKNANNKIIFEKGKEGFVYFDLSKSETCRKVKNYIRRILGSNIEGLYLAEKENSIYNCAAYGKIDNGISVMWQSIIYEASLEYLSPKTLIFDSLTASTYCYGFYLIDSKKILSLRYKKYLENLKNSGIFNIAISFNLFEGAVFKSFEKKVKKKCDIIYK